MKRNRVLENNAEFDQKILMIDKVGTIIVDKEYVCGLKQLNMNVYFGLNC